MGVRFSIGRLCLAVLLAAVLIGLDLGLVLANGGDVHGSGLSGGATLVIALIGTAVVGIFVGLFLWKWRQTLASSTPPAEGEGRGPEIENRDQE